MRSPTLSCGSAPDSGAMAGAPDGDGLAAARGDDARGIADRDGVIGHVAGDHGAGTDRSPRADLHTRQHNDAMAEPGIVADLDVAARGHRLLPNGPVRLQAVIVGIERARGSDLHAFADADRSLVCAELAAGLNERLVIDDDADAGSRLEQAVAADSHAIAQSHRAAWPVVDHQNAVVEKGVEARAELYVVDPRTCGDIALGRQLG